MSGAGRPPRGPALGVLDGQHPHPSLGLVPASGAAHFDEFLGVYTKTAAPPYGVYDTGSGGLVTDESPSALTEVGILKLTTDSASLSYLSVYGAAGALYGLPPGLLWGAKWRLSQTSDSAAFSGFCDSFMSPPLVAAAVSFIGLRQINTGAWFGVVKDGATAANETTVDLGIGGDTSFYAAGFRVTPTGGVQFFTVESDARVGPVLTDVGDEVTTNIPAVALRPLILGAFTSTAAVKRAEIDWWALGGRSAR